MRELEAGEAGLLVVNVCCILLPTFPFCPFALLGTMRSALLLAAILALSLAQGAVCEESQEQMVPRGGRKEVRYPSSWACPGRVLGTSCEQHSAGPKSCRGAGGAELSLRGLHFPASLVNSCFHCLGVSVSLSLCWSWTP